MGAACPHAAATAPQSCHRRRLRDRQSRAPSTRPSQHSGARYAQWWLHHHNSFIVGIHTRNLEEIIFV